MFIWFFIPIDPSYYTTNSQRHQQDSADAKSTPLHWWSRLPVPVVPRIPRIQVIGAFENVITLNFARLYHRLDFTRQQHFWYDMKLSARFFVLRIVATYFLMYNSVKFCTRLLVRCDTLCSCSNPLKTSGEGDPKLHERQLNHCVSVECQTTFTDVIQSDTVIRPARAYTVKSSVKSPKVLSITRCFRWRTWFPWDSVMLVQPPELMQPRRSYRI